MVVDRGGLRYPVSIQDRFSEPLRRFQEGISRARREVEGFGRSFASLRGTATAINEAATATNRLADAQARLASASQRTRKDTGQEAQARREAAQAAQAQAQADAARSRARKDAAVAEAAAERRRTQEVQRAARAAVQRQAAEQRAAAAQQRASTQATAATARSTAGSRTLNRELSRTERAANRVAFTFRRLFGILAAFTLAREGIRGFRELISLGVQFNNTIALTRLGFAGVIQSAAELRNAQGQILEGQEAFNAALSISARIQDTLRRRALETTATFQELSFAFQQAIAPGIERGFNIDQILELTVRLSQAATSIGLEQNKLAEEVRSILSGTARAQTTRLAALLGGATEINRLNRETTDANELFRLLTERFEGTSRAASEAARTIPGLTARLKDALGIVTGAAAQDLTQSLLGTLQEVFDTLLVVNQQGVKEPNPRVVEGFEAIFDAVNAVVVALRDVGRRIGLEGFITAAQTLGTVLETAGRVLAGIIDGVRLIGTLVLALLEPFAGIVEALLGTEESLGSIAELLGTILSSVVAVRLGIILWRRALRLFGVEAVVTATSVQAIQTAVVGIVPRLLRMAGIFGLITAGVLQLTNLLFGLDIGVGGFVRTLGQGLRTAFEGFFRFAEFGFKNLANFVTGLFTGGNVQIFDLERERQEVQRFLDEVQSEAGNIFTDITGIREGFAGLVEDSLVQQAGASAQLRQDLTELRQLLARPLQSDAILQRIETLQQRIEAASAAIDEATLTQREAPASRQERNALRTANQRARLVEIQAANERDLVDAIREGATQEELAVEQQQNKLALLQNELVSLRENLAAQRDKLQEELKGENSLQKRFLLVGQLIATDREREAGEARITAELERQRLAVLDALRQREEARFKVQESLAEVQRETSLILQQAQAQRNLNNLRAQGASQPAIQAQQTRDRIAAIRLEAEARRQETEAQLRLLRFRLQNERGDQQRLVLQAQINNLVARQGAEQQVVTESIREQNDLLARQQVLAEGGFGAGIAEGIRQLAEELPTAAQIGVDFIRSAVTGLGQFISQTIVDAFDPTKDNTIVENFARLLQQLAQQLLQSLFLKLITDLLAGSDSGGSSTTSPTSLLLDTGLGGFQSRWQGGKIEPQGRPSLGHFTHPRGLHTGGPTAGRPKGIHPSDTVPIWAAPGEFMMRVSAVRKYGLDLMSKLNAGIVDPSSLRSLAAATGRSRVLRPVGGFATGGQVTQVPQPPSGGQARGAGMTPSYIISNEDAAERLLAGGAPAIRQFILDMAPDIRAAGG